MTSRPVSITDPTHPVSVAAVVSQGLIGLWLLTGVASSPALGGILPASVFAVVPAIMLGASVVSLGAIVAVHRSADAVALLPWMAVEAVAKAVLGGVSLAYALAMTSTYGFAGGPTTQTYAWVIGAGLCARTIQIVRQRARLREAASNPTPATPAPLGEHDATHG